MYLRVSAYHHVSMYIYQCISHSATTSLLKLNPNLELAVLGSDHDKLALHEKYDLSMCRSDVMGALTDVVQLWQPSLHKLQMNFSEIY